MTAAELAGHPSVLITQIGVDALTSWEPTGVDSRRRYREVQFRAVARDQPELAATVLRDLCIT